VSLYPYNAGNMTMTIPIAKFADLHDKIKSRDAENARLKSELTDLKSTADKSKADVERLTEAGDAMVEELNGRYFGKQLINDWNAAKEGETK